MSPSQFYTIVLVGGCALLAFVGVVSLVIFMLAKSMHKNGHNKK